MARDDYTPEQRRAWAARQDAIRAQGGWKASQAKLSAAIDKSLKANAPAPAPKSHNSKRPRALVADTSGSSAFSDIRWKSGEVYYTFTNGYSYSDPLSKQDFLDWRDSDSLGKWWNENLK